MVMTMQTTRTVRTHRATLVTTRPEILTGTQASSILVLGGQPIPPIAADSAGRRFAVADGTEVVVVEVDMGDAASR